MPLHFVNTADITLLLVDLTSLICSHCTPFFVMYTCSHSNLPGPLTEENVCAECLMMAVTSSQTFTVASESHAFFHHNTTA